MILLIDIGGSYLRYEIRDNNKVIKKGKLKSAQIGLCAFIEKILEHEKIKTVAISYAGQVNNGKILSSPHIKIDRHNIKEYIEHKYGVKLYIENDLNCSILAEANCFKAKDIANIAVGTGLGLGVISSGTLIKGSGGIATELGHIPYKESPFTCSCGKNNCIELFASGSGLKLWQEYYKFQNYLKLEELQKSSSNNGIKIYKQFREALLFACGVAVTLFNPKILVLGGGIIQSNPQLINLIQKEIANYAMPLSTENLEIRKSYLDDAPLQGAYLLTEDKND